MLDRWRKTWRDEQLDNSTVSPAVAYIQWRLSLNAWEVCPHSHRLHPGLSLKGLGGTGSGRLIDFAIVGLLAVFDFEIWL